MRKNYFKKGLCLGLAGMLAFSTTGCIKSELADMSEEEKDLCVEYAANLLLKHDRNYIDRMPYVEPEQTTAEPETKQDFGNSENPDNPTTSQNPSPSNPSGSTESNITNLNDIFGFNGLDISPNGYQIADSYPSNGSELGMSMIAVKGYKLLICRLNVTNTSGSDITLDMLEQGASYRGIVNDTVRMNVQATALLDAFNTYKGTIPAGSTQEMVLIFQINAADTNNISSVKLSVTYNDKQGTVVIS